MFQGAQVPAASRLAALHHGVEGATRRHRCPACGDVFDCWDIRVVEGVGLRCEKRCQPCAYAGVEPDPTPPDGGGLAFLRAA